MVLISRFPSRNAAFNLCLPMIEMPSFHRRQYQHCWRANMLLAFVEAFAGQGNCGASLAWREGVFIRAEKRMSS